jgi:SPP1 gp7 family putative phage head morphogenesis protein
MSAGAYQADLLTDLRMITDKAIAGGTDIREFRKQFRPLVERYGWQLKGGGPAWRSDLIWRTNISTAYSAGRWQQFEAAEVEYLEYMHNDSVMHPRPKHLAMDGIILPRTDPFWQINYTPNGFGCRCRAVAASKQQFEDAAPDKTEHPENWQDLPDKGWDYNVGTASKQHLADTMMEKMDRMPPDIGQAWMRWIEQMGLQEWITR